MQQPGIIITNTQLYNDAVLDVTTRFTSFDGRAWKGKIRIETETEGTIALDGRHEYNDYEEQYGFILMAEQ
ncbi:hypothetical protein SAMN05444266_102229 [Chitinophaga jiangningensis]|uniref:Uncharacterized protein n=1 Tax=Chitinophaga jiangningensis TaxID=1419482 RepID=A0A1M6YAH8_9BACT|nr:hypothetical protein [Chitinophaga jiangningensis]SHL15287.1 hypothetical protein SAMN05444266_102229 [Chitinophaga jiangningensis]